jgi:RIO kinase 1
MSAPGAKLNNSFSHSESYYSQRAFTAIETWPHWPLQAALPGGGCRKRRERPIARASSPKSRRAWDDEEEWETPATSAACPVAELQSFYDQGYLEGRPNLVRSGKEATVYCCLVPAWAGGGFRAAKVYRSRQNRSFRNDAVYREGRVVLDRRIERAIQKNTDAGRAAGFGLWIQHEWETLNQLHAAGADVPRPVACAGSALLMEFIGEGSLPAPSLQGISLAKEEALPLFRQLLRNLKLWLSCHLVHGDLSPYNVLYQEGKVTVIDFPQAVDARRNRNAYSLLLRDVENVCGYFARWGVRSHPARLVHDLWTRYRLGEIG